MGTNELIRLELDGAEIVLVGEDVAEALAGLTGIDNLTLPEPASSALERHHMERDGQW